MRVKAGRMWFPLAPRPLFHGKLGNRWLPAVFFFSWRSLRQKWKKNKGKMVFFPPKRVSVSKVTSLSFQVEDESAKIPRRFRLRAYWHHVGYQGYLVLLMGCDGEMEEKKGTTLWMTWLRFARNIIISNTLYPNPYVSKNSLDGVRKDCI